MKKIVVIIGLVFSLTIPAQVTPVIYQDSTKNGDTLSCVTFGVTSGHEWVDLCLPSGLLWATTSAGASSPYQYEYTYNVTAFASPWRLPTKADFEELLEYCNGEWVTRNGINGYEFTSKQNGVKVFFAASGTNMCVNSYWEQRDVGIGGTYVSSDISSNNYGSLKSYWALCLSQDGFYIWSVLTYTGYESQSKYYSKRSVLIESGLPIVTLSLICKENGSKNLYKCGKDSLISFSAIPLEGHHFVKWSDGNTDNPRTISINSDTIFMAEFAPNEYTITTIGSNGKIYGGGIYPYGSTVTLTAIPNDHYHFIKWDDGNVDNPRQVVVTQDSSFAAEFVKVDSQETVKCTVVNESPYGTVSFTGKVIKDSTISLQATAPECSKFVKWSDNDTSNPRSLSVSQDTTLTAIFEKIQYKITLETDESKGEVNGE